MNPRGIVKNGTTTPRYLAAIQAASSVILAGSMIALLRYYNRNRTASSSELPNTIPNQDQSHNSEVTPPFDLRKRNIARNVVGLLITIAVLVAALQLGAMDTPTGMAVLAGGGALYLGWTFWTSYWTGRSDLVRRVRNLILFAVMVAFAALLIAASPDLQARTFLVFWFAAAGSLWLWSTEMFQEGSRHNLGAALLAGTLIACALFYIEHANQEVERYNQIRVTVGLQKDLSGADLVAEDLSYAHLYKKRFREADLSRADLTEAFLEQADLKGAWLNGAILTRANLTEAVAAEAKLEEANLNSAFLEDTNFEGAELYQAKLVGVTTVEDAPTGNNFQSSSLVEADLSEADLRNSNFAYADFENATLNRANLTNANLMGAILTKAKLEGTQLHHSNLRDLDLTTVDLSATRLSEAAADSSTSWPTGFDPAKAGIYVLKPQADLHKANLSGQDLTSVSLMAADLRGANFDETNLTWGRLNRADLRGVDLTGANIANSVLIGADLRGAVLNGVNLKNVELARARLQGSSLLGADLRTASLAGSQLHGAKADRDTRWPRGFNAEAAGVRLVKSPVVGD